MAATKTPLLPPQDLHAELAVLGAIVQSADAMNEAVAALTPADFYDGRHRKLFEAAVRLYARSEPVDARTLAGECEVDLDNPGWSYMLVVDAIEACPIAANVGNYARLVRDRSQARRILTAIQTAEQLARSNAPDLASEVERLIYAATVKQVDDSLSIGELAAQVEDMLERAAQGDETTLGIPTGFRHLDRLIGGLRPGQLVLVAGRPGMGKTALMSNIARTVAGSGTSVGFFSLEMSPLELGLRVVCADARVSWASLQRDSNLTDAAGWQRVVGVVESLRPVPLMIATAHPTAVKLLSWCRRHKPGLVVVDYLQLMASPARDQSRNDAVAEVSRALKLLAMEMQIPVLAASQLNRDSARTGNPPRLSELRDSGSLEQDSDIVVFIHEKPGGLGLTEHELIVAKHRNGETGKVPIRFLKSFMRFEDI